MIKLAARATTVPEGAGNTREERALMCAENEIGP